MDRVVRPVDPQIGFRPGDRSGDLQTCRMHRPFLSAERARGFHGRQEAILEIGFWLLFECRDHSCGNRLIFQEIASGGDIWRAGDVVGSQHALAAEGGAATVTVDDAELAILDLEGFVDDLGHRFVSRFSLSEQIEQALTQARIGDVLAARRADTRADIGAPRGYRWAGRGDGNTESAGALAIAGNRECHFAIRSSGITAVASISTTHSGRASAFTTIPVDTGKTPFSHLPTTG